MMRVSDDQRQRTVDELRRHCQAGRLDVDEYGSRIEKAMASSTLQELDELTADLPMIRIADPVGTRTRISSALSGRLEPSEDYMDPSMLGARLTSTLLVLLTSVVFLATVALGLAESWLWASVLLAVWLIGIGQGRLIGSLAKRSRR